MSLLDTRFARQVGIEVPLVCGAMFPCTSPELVAAVSGAGAIAVVQPMSFVYIHGWDYRAGLRWVEERTTNPIGVNLILESKARIYEDRLRRWLDVSLEEGVRWFVTALGNPRWVVERVHAAGGLVYHDVTERKWAEKAIDGGVDGLVCVNSRAGGHAGPRTAEQLRDELGDLGLPLLCAGGIGNEADFVRALRMGYDGVQMGTRFIATDECRAHADYKQAIVDAKAEDIVLTRKLTGVPVAVIKTPYVERIGTEAGPLARWMLKGRRTKHWMRAIYALQSAWKLKRASLRSVGYGDYLQAGKSVDGIDAVEPAGAVVERFRRAAQEAGDEAGAPRGD